MWRAKVPALDVFMVGGRELGDNAIIRQPRQWLSGAAMF